MGRDRGVPVGVAVEVGVAVGVGLGVGVSGVADVQLYDARSIGRRFGYVQAKAHGCNRR